MLIPSIRARIRAAERYLPGWLNPDEDIVGRVQLQKIKMVWADAVQNVPYYRGLVETSQAPKKIESLEQFFSEVPKLERKTIQSRPSEFIRMDRPPDYRRATGGSTGEPIQFGIFKSELRDAAADVMVGRMAHGMNLASDRMFILFGHSHLLGTGWRGKKNHLERKLRDLLLNYKRVDAYFLNEERAIRVLDEIRRFEPHVIYGYSCAIDALVRLTLHRKDTVTGIVPKMTILTAEPLPRQDSRQLVESFFSAPVVFEYGGVDFGSVAYEKPAGPYGVFWWNQLAEEDGAANNDNALLVTPLYVRYLPLIRYSTGDHASGGRAPRHCGILEFESLAGRINDMIKIGDTVIHSVAFAHCLKDEPHILNMQLVLDPQGIRLVLVGRRDPASEQRIRRRMADLSPHLRDCRMEYADDVETTLAGKRRWVVDRRKVPA